MTTDPIQHELAAAADALRHAMRDRAAWHLRAARFAAAEFAWTVQDLRNSWRSIRASI